MSQANRDTLRKHFKAGSRPTAEHFAQLIDSTLNIVEDGIYKTDDDGLQVRALPGHQGLMSFYRPQSQDEADWSLVFGKMERQLILRAGSASGTSPRPALLSLDATRVPQDEDREVIGRIGVGLETPRPQTRLDVAGAVGMSGRLGSAAEAPGPVLADGKPHRITRALQGCHAFEVVAGVGQPDSDSRFALVHGIALNAHNPSRWNDWFGRKTRIQQHHAWYERRCDRLELSWEGGHGKGQDYWLTIRSRCDYQADARRRKGGQLAPADEVVIQVFVTELWFNPLMAGSRASAPAVPSANGP
jgi:hypothetical protein